MTFDSHEPGNSMWERKILRNYKRGPRNRAKGRTEEAGGSGDGTHIELLLHGARPPPRAVTRPRARHSVDVLLDLLARERQGEPRPV